jgi:hypothetical protein
MRSADADRPPRKSVTVTNIVYRLLLRTTNDNAVRKLSARTTANKTVPIGALRLRTDRSRWTPVGTCYGPSFRGSFGARRFRGRGQTKRSKRGLVIRRGTNRGRQIKLPAGPVPETDNARTATRPISRADGAGTLVPRGPGILVLGFSKLKKSFTASPTDGRKISRTPTQEKRFNSPFRK